MNFTSVDLTLSSFVARRAFPGASALIADSTGVLHTVAVGRLTYDPSSPLVDVTSTLFDIASLTKVTATTTVAMLLYQWGALKLDEKIAEAFGPEFTATDVRKASITVADLLTHSAGLPPDPTPACYCTPQFACPETLAHPPSERKLTFSCQSQVLAQLNAQTLDRPPRAKFVYSDISMLLLKFVLGRLARPYVSPSELRPDCTASERHGPSVAPPDEAVIAGIDQCYFGAFARKFIFRKLARTARAHSPLLTRGTRSRQRPLDGKLGGTLDETLDGTLGGTLDASTGRAAARAPFMGFLPPAPLWAFVAPTWNDTAEGFPGECVEPYRERVLQGEVSDGNAFSLGGVAGHAGVFASAPSLHGLMHELLFAPEASPATETVLGINRTTARLFTTVVNSSFSSRALGWDTNQPGGYLGCGRMPAATFTHTGYTGTLLCGDPQTRGGLITVLLTNRVYPHADAQSSQAIHEARQAFNNAVLDAVVGGGVR